MKEVNPYLNFDGDCREAMTFYNDALGGRVEFMPFMDDHGKPIEGPDARVMHANIAVGGHSVLMASDTRPEDPPKIGTNVSVSIQCETVEEIERLYAGLSKGGVVTLPLSDVPWGARFGMFIDRYGIHWLLNCQLPAA